MDSDVTLFEIAKPAAGVLEEEATTNERAGLRETDQSEDGAHLNAGRFVRYQFTPQVWKRFSLEQYKGTLKTYQMNPFISHFSF